MSDDEFVSDLAPEEADRFWLWLNRSEIVDGKFQPSELERVNMLLASLPNEPEPGRNDKCPCNSGLKFKKCCGK